MKNARAHSRGFTLIASLLMLLLLSGIAIGLLMMVNTEGRVGAADVQNNVAYHAAEGGIEKMANDLATTFANAQSPSASDICALSNLAPTIPGISWSYYNVQPATGVCTGSLANHTVNGVSSEQWGQIGSGPNQNLWAQIIPITMTATAQTLGGMEVSMTRSAEVALIPVFQFGVFCEDDCAFFSTPNLDFNGRLHTNGDLYLGAAGGYTLTFHSKLEAYGNVVTNNLPNTLAANSSANDTGTVYIPTADGNCAFQGGASSTCVAMPDADGSVAGNGGDPPQSSYNTAFNTFSGTVNHEIINGNYGNTTSGQVGTGAKLLSMPFVTGTIHPYELIRRPTSLDTTALSDSREYDMAQILVLLSDDPNDFSSLNLPGSPVRLANITSAEATATGGTVSNPYGIATSTPSNMTALASGSSYATYFAAATNGWLPDTTSCAGAACPLIKTCGSGNSTCQPQYLPPDWLFAPASFAGWSTTQGLQPQYAPVMFAESNTSTANSYPTFALCSTTTNNGSLPTGCNATVPAKPYFVVPNQTNAATWNLIDGYLYVGYVDAAGTWHNVTNEWLQLGFARDVTPPTAIGGNDINPKAILLLQQPADRAGNGGEPDATGIAPACSQWNTGKTSCTGQWSNPLPPEVVADAAVPASPAAPQPYFGVTTGITGTTPAPASGSTLWAKTGQSISMFNWYPINFYDAREGEPRDVTTNQSNDSCTTNGVMNAVEIDVGNLQRWLAGTIGTSGTNVDYVAQNGYVLYFSDRRGMLLNPYPPMEMGQSSAPAAKSGDSGLEDVINSGSSAGTPDGALESPMAGLAVDGVALDSPEDVNLNGHLDNFGAANLGLGQWSGTLNATTGQIGSAVNQNTQIVAASPDNPYSPRIATCGVTGRKNWVSGARHVLKLVDGALGNLPLSPNGGGFTVASENPVYVQGNYNSRSSDTFFTNATSGKPGADMTSPAHSPAAVIADTVTLLSNNWNDGNSTLLSPTQPVNNRPASTTYYRMAIAGGKTIRFTFPSWAISSDYPMGTDGGIGNFLRLLEDWYNGNNPYTLNYGGSLVSLYFSTYNTGIFKCCIYSVYAPPTRKYIFDTDFTTPQGLPPGTPMFKDVETLGYRQLFTTRTN